MTYEYLESRLGWGYNFFNKECLPWGCTKNTDYTGFEEEAADTDLGKNEQRASDAKIFILAMVTLTFYLIRKEKQLLVTVLVPTLIIAFLSALSAVIPNNSGEKYGLAKIILN